MTFYILRQANKRNYNNSNKWLDCSLIDSEGYFRGQAVFDTEKEAADYKKLYEQRIQKRNEQNHSHNQGSKISLKLKIFVENEMPQINYPFYFNFKKRSYN